MDRGLIGSKIARGIGRRRRRFSQHVIGIAEAVRLHRSGPGECFADGLPHDELFTHHPHGEIDALADQRFSASGDQSDQRIRQRALARGPRQFAGDHQSPGRGVDEQRRAVTEMGAPVAAADLVADQRIARGAVGNTQQCFRQTHQRHALLAR